MQTMYITTQRGFPKQLLQRVQFLQIVAAKPLQFQYKTFSNIHNTRKIT